MRERVDGRVCVALFAEFACMAKNSLESEGALERERAFKWLEHKWLRISKAMKKLLSQSTFSVVGPGPGAPGPGVRGPGWPGPQPGLEARGPEPGAGARAAEHVCYYS